MLLIVFQIECFLDKEENNKDYLMARDSAVEYQCRPSSTDCFGKGVEVIGRSRWY